MNTNTSLNSQDLLDEQFCQTFELNAMADLLIRKETERWVSGFANLIVEKEHNSRYDWISKDVQDKAVLDIACGIGKGSFKLANEGNARIVVGCDLDETAIKYASIRYKHPNVTFIAQDAELFQDNKKYDVIVCFETIEHLPNVNSFLEKMAGLLTQDGYFYVSTPISNKGLDLKPTNPFHLQEWGFNEFNELISQHFLVEETYLQMRNEIYPSVLFSIKKKLLNLIEPKRASLVKEKYLGETVTMHPVRFDHEDHVLFQHNYGVVGYQILKCKLKNEQSV